MGKFDIAPLRPPTLAIFRSWGSSAGAGRIRLTRCKSSNFFWSGPEKFPLPPSWKLFFRESEIQKTGSNTNTGIQQILIH
jgi:hypothetical protein